MSSGLLYIISHIVHMLPNTRFWKFKRFLYGLCGISCSKGVRICSNVIISGTSNLSIGCNTWIGHEVFILASHDINIGSNVNIAPRVFIGTGTHEIDMDGPSIAGQGYSMPITIGDGAWLCAGSIILAGVRIGRKSIIAAGAVVTQDVPDKQLWGGVPAKFIRKLE